MRGLALGILLVGVAIGVARLAPAPSDRTAPPRSAPPPPDAPIEPAGEALIYRALLIRERGDRYGAHAMGRAIASGAAGPVAAERARLELLSEPPPQTVELPLTERFREVRFDDRGQVEVLSADRRTLFDPATGETLRDVHRSERQGPPPTRDRERMGTKARISDDWRVLAERDRRQELAGRRTQVMGDRILVLEGREVLTTIDAPAEGWRFVEAAVSADGSTVCAGARDGRVLLREVDGDAPLVGELDGAITSIAPLPAREGEAPAFVVGTSRGEVVRAARGRERGRNGSQRRGAPVVALERLARDGPPVRWAAVEADGTPVVLDDEGVLTWTHEQRLNGVTVDPVPVARRVMTFAPSEPPIAAALDPAGGRVAVLQRDALRLVSLEPGLPLCPVPGGDVHADASTARDTNRVVLKNDESIAVCDVERPGAPLLTVPLRNRREGLRTNARLSADGRLLFVSGPDETRIVAVDSGERVGHIAQEWGATVSPDGRVASTSAGLVATDDGSRVHPDCLDEDRNAMLRMLEAAEVFVAIEDERLVVCELDDEGDLLFRTERYDELPGRADYGWAGSSANGSHLWLGTNDGKVRLFELPGGRLVRTFHAGESGMPHATVANGGAYVMTESSRGRTRLFVTATGEQVLERQAEPMGTDGPGAPPETFTGDGEHYARIYGIQDGVQTTWVSATGEELPVTRPIDFGLTIEVAGQAFPLGSGPDLVATSGHGLAIFRATAAGLRPLMRVRPSAMAVTHDGRFVVWWGDSVRRVPVGTSGPDAAALTADLTNHRVCRGSFDPVVVMPSEIDDPIWAPDGYCD